MRARVEEELRKVAEPYRTTVILRDLEEMSYEEIAEVAEVSLGTVKSRLTRGREALEAGWRDMFAKLVRNWDWKVRKKRFRSQSVNCRRPQKDLRCRHEVRRGKVDVLAVP